MQNVKQKITEEKMLIHRYDHQIAETRQKAESALPLLQAIVDTAREAGLEINAENFYSAAMKPEKFSEKHFTALMPDQMIGNFKMKKSGLMQAVELPDISHFVMAAKNFNENTKRSLTPVNLLTVEDGKAIIDEVQYQIMVESCSRYITHPKAKLVWTEYVKLFDQINAFNEVMLKECSTGGIDLLNFNYYAEWKKGKLAPSLSAFLSLTERFK